MSHRLPAWDHVREAVVDPSRLREGDKWTEKASVMG
jgi:hypothetical protein